MQAFFFFSLVSRFSKLHFFLKYIFPHQSLKGFPWAHSLQGDLVPVFRILHLSAQCSRDSDPRKPLSAPALLTRCGGRKRQPVWSCPETRHTSHRRPVQPVVKHVEERSRAGLMALGSPAPAGYLVWGMGGGGCFTGHMAFSGVSLRWFNQRGCCHVPDALN